MEAKSSEYVYQVPQSRRLVITVLSFVGIVVASIILSLVYAHGVSLAAALGITIAMYLSSNQKITVTPEKMIFKAFLAKSKEFPYSEGSFALNEITGAKALFMSFSPRAMTLDYTPHSGGKKTSIGILFPIGDVEDIFQKIRSY